MKDLPPLPLTHAALERYRISSRMRRRPGAVGAHQTRRKGQSLEFRDFRQYIPGDDIRHVDWRASTRHGGEMDLLVREFAAEEQLTLLISIDLRQTMRLPQAMPKALVALWLAEAISVILLRSGDQVAIHSLFGGSSPEVQTLKGRTGLTRIRRCLKGLLDRTNGGDGPNLSGLQRFLPPASAWLVISDFYFDQNAGLKLGEAMARARDGFRWTLSLDLDSWPHEKTLLGSGARQIQGPGSGLARVDPKLVEIDHAGLAQVEAEIARHKEVFGAQRLKGRQDVLHWFWPEDAEPDPAAFFIHQFENDGVLQRLFMREY